MDVYSGWLLMKVCKRDEDCVGGERNGLNSEKMREMIQQYEVESTTVVVM